jgi:uncharacterized protein YegP (UPF0339 family)
LDQRDEERRHGRFELYPSHGAWRFRLAWGEETLLISSGDYASPDRALRDIELIRDPGASFGPCMSADGSFYFECKSAAGDLIGTSRMFEVPRDRDDACEWVARLIRDEIEVVHRES